ncbi:GLPGLI family protein [Kaistella faecalis]|uniref:GLPGLI family protein n=1 Tax=Kaistella faecalis TaxID=2852098 RepID=UPI001C4502B9|nr:GLPGLI family protein [Chryseobacterium faecale]UFK96783.1 GLPGLI family protein [Chryseobacterium faecale]
MKKIGLIVLGLTSQIIFAQANRFIYQVTMKIDSTNRSEIKTENAYLDVTPEKSIFYGEKRLQRDSLFTRMRQTNGGSFDRTQMQNLRSHIDFTIEKDFKTGKNTYNSRIARDQYSYDEDRTMEWKILAETAKIGDYKTQKAQTNFGGRTWFAWFTTDVPFQDGPYKFSGLPGLIVKVEDSKGDYSFDLKETKKIGALTNLSQGGNIVKVKRKDYEKQEALFRKDPASFMQTSMRGGSAISAPQTRGGSMRTPDPAQRKQMEDRMKEEMKKNNNPIELK